MEVIPGLPRGSAGLPFGLPISTIATYSVTAAVLVQVVGFIITTQYYSRAGVGVGSIPLHLMLAAGLSFAVITGFYLYVGAAVGTMSRSVKTWADLREVILYGVSFAGFLFILMLMFLLRWPGTGIYCSLIMLVGTLVGRFGLPSYWPAFASPDRLMVPDLGRFLLPILFATWLFARLVYPNLSRALGGGAPLPVVIDFAPEYQGLVPAGAGVYEVLSTPDFVYLELVFDLQYPSAKTLVEKEEKRSWFPLVWPPRRYVQVRASTVRSIERLHPFESAPPTPQKSGSAPPSKSSGAPDPQPPTIAQQTPAPQPPADICLPTGEARKQ